MKSLNFLLGIFFIFVFLLPLFSPVRSEGMKSYLPGDFVHVMVEAPLDTSQVSSIMPDGSKIELVQERTTNVWHNYWQIPTGFKKGVYYVALKSVDLEGKDYEGRVGPFAINEPTLAARMVETATSTAEEKKVAVISSAAIPPKAIKLKHVDYAASGKKNPDKISLMVRARAYLEKMDLKKAKEQIMALLKIEGENMELRSMLGRIDVVLKTRAGNQ